MFSGYEGFWVIVLISEALVIGAWARKAYWLRQVHKAKVERDAYLAWEEERYGG